MHRWTPPGAPQHSTTRKQEHGSRGARSGRVCVCKRREQQTHPEPAGPAIAGAFGEQIPGCHTHPECRGSTIAEASTMTPQAWQRRKDKSDPIVLLYCRVPAFVSCCVEGLPMVSTVQWLGYAIQTWWVHVLCNLHMRAMVRTCLWISKVRWFEPEIETWRNNPTK